MQRVANAHNGLGSYEALISNCKHPIVTEAAIGPAVCRGRHLLLGTCPEVVCPGRSGCRTAGRQYSAASQDWDPHRFRLILLCRAGLVAAFDRVSIEHVLINCMCKESLSDQRCEYNRVEIISERTAT